MKIQELQTRIEKLPLNEQDLVLNHLSSLIEKLYENNSSILISKKEAESRDRTLCSSSHTIKICKHHRIQRFSCKD